MARLVIESPEWREHACFQRNMPYLPFTLAKIENFERMPEKLKTHLFDFYGAPETIAQNWGLAWRILTYHPLPFKKVLVEFLNELDEGAPEHAASYVTHMKDRGLKIPPLDELNESLAKELAPLFKKIGSS